MAQMPSSAGGPSPSRSAPNDIYTVLISIALAIVLGTVGFVIYRCNELLGSPFPAFTG